MALLFPWATKEYLLWEMSLAQVILYHNIGVDIQHPKPEGDKPSLQNMSKKTKQQAIKEAKRIWREAKDEEDRKQSEERKEPYRAKYGDV
jgi:hypothetical protein